MNEHEQFEAELAALKPQPPSAGLKARIADRLGKSQPGQKRITPRWTWQVALALSIVIAVTAIVAMQRWQHTSPPPIDVVAAAIDWKSTLSPSRPTLWRFHQAAALPGGLDELLDQHSARGAAASPQTIHAGAFSIFVSTEPTTAGEL